MPLVTRGRLSVQPVGKESWEVIQVMAKRGGWEEMTFGKKRPSTSNLPRKPKSSTKKSGHIQKSKVNSSDDDGSKAIEVEPGASEEIVDEMGPKKGKKRKASEVDGAGTNDVPQRRSLRARKER